MGTPAKPLKIGLVLDDGLDSPDGVQQYILTIGNWLREQGHEVRYLVGQTSRRDIEGAHSLSRNIRVSSNGNHMSIPLPTSRRKLRRFLEAENFDVLHVQTPYSPFMGEQLIMLAGPATAIIGTFHILPNSWLASLGTRALGLLSRMSLRRFDAMLSVSPAAAEFARRTFGLQSTVLPNVINYQRFHGARPLAEYDDDALTILFLGRLVPRKGCLLLLRAITRLRTETGLPKFRVLICGRGPQEAKLRQFIDNNQLQDIVTLKGFVSEADKPRYYASADIAVFPSGGGESFGIVLIEAMAAGKAAVLAGDNPGYRSVMDAREELLFDARDPGALAEKLAFYMKDGKRRRQARDWESGHAKQFDVNIVGAKLLDIYQKALLKKRGA